MTSRCTTGVGANGRSTPIRPRRPGRPCSMARRGAGNSKPETKLVAAGRGKQWTSAPALAGGVVNPPVWRGSTHLYDDMADHAAGRPNADGHFYYGRRGGPTLWALAEALTELEPGAAGTLLYPSGVAASTGALLALLDAGDELLSTDIAYFPSRMFADGLLKRFGVSTRYFDPLDIEAFRDMFTGNTRAVLLESPGSQTMEVCDVPALAAIARENGAVSLLDNTWATPLGFAALEHGCDIAIMSLTKHVGGHSDLLMGSVSAREDYLVRLRRTYQLLGQVVSPDDAALDARERVGIGYSFGGFESLVIPFDPAGARTVRAWPLAHMDPQDRLGVRLSIGLEDVEDLVADLERGFAAMEQQ